MGYRVHFAKVHKVEWAGGSFNWQQEQFSTMISENMDESYASEDGDTIELLPEDVKKYISELRKLDPESPSKYFDGYTNKEEADALQEMLDGYDKDNSVINLCWF